MFTVNKKGSPYKIRDINIAISYNSSGRTLVDVAEEYDVSRERIRQIHGVVVRHVLKCMGKYTEKEKIGMKHHTDEVSGYLKQYKQFLINNGY